MTIVAERPHANYPGSKYVLPNDRPECDRLNTQHELLKDAFGRIIFPPIHFRDGDRILDCGTASGIWIHDAAQTLPPTVHFEGIDIQSALFPASPPPNMHFSVQSILDLPPSWSSSFTLVNQRLLGGAFTLDNWTQSIKEAHRVLKPGGYVQMLEFDGRLIDDLRLYGPNSARYHEIASRLWEGQGLVREDVVVLPKLLAENGFDDVQTETREIRLDGTDGAAGAANLRNLHLVYSAMAGAVMRAGGFGLVGSEKEYLELMDRVRDEMATSEHAVMKWAVIYGRKKAE
ncbi:S-adenosyl-L-methionine-dependent methyltransferase [Coniophora puteana RWD-64-598 SS2]|uniref:S-adenosyl-L-methionine-dependent methyltransferase n=1 Tax=Coniophora puteana (strain RWD-64-598) TaxID=741705 RepID=A0A5M3M718_CONPW|nr:S-adenosyl-L-methionine-dependent methyltransferase [Coniophora puteana RWD-64-598 SS2]EIW74863.1 S-adenosyl-L-methionine-dependent methyltransferase [Coniophora puteana RWD-64-598 SS2]